MWTCLARAMHVPWRRAASTPKAQAERTKRRMACSKERERVQGANFFCKIFRFEGDGTRTGKGEDALAASDPRAKVSLTMAWGSGCRLPAAEPWKRA